MQGLDELITTDPGLICPAFVKGPDSGFCLAVAGIATNSVPQLWIQLISTRYQEVYSLSNWFQVTRLPPMYLEFQPASETHPDPSCSARGRTGLDIFAHRHSDRVSVIMIVIV
jgi:hypothetical protein